MTFFDYLSILSYSLTALGYIMTNMLWLRIYMLIACAMDAAIYLFIRPGNPLWVQVAMNIAFVLINGYALIQLIQDRFPPRFYGEIGEIYKKIFFQLRPTEFKLLLAIAEWKTVGPGVPLIQAGEENISPLLMVQGQVLIEQNEKVISTINQMVFLGEINFLTGIVPQNDAITAEETRLFILPKEKLLNLIEKNGAIKAVIYSCFGRDIAIKLKQMNQEMSASQKMTLKQQL